MARFPQRGNWRVVLPANLAWVAWAGLAALVGCNAAPPGAAVDSMSAVANAGASSATSTGTSDGATSGVAGTPTAGANGNGSPAGGVGGSPASASGAGGDEAATLTGGNGGGTPSGGGGDEAVAGAGGGASGTAMAGGSPAGGSGGAATGGAPSAGWSTIRNGGYWNDTDGDRIEAHGGGFYFEDGTWYWIGEDKAHNAGTFQAVNCYASKDLENWDFQNAIITRATDPELDTADRIIERPKLTFNASTGRYVMWLHWEGKDYAPAEAGVFSSDSVCGDYDFEAHFRPFSNMSRDDNLFLDDDGTAYFMSAANENKDLIIYELTPDFLDVERQVITLWPSSWREAPAMFKRGDTYFLVTSGATGWDPNQAQYSHATSIEGPWAALRNLGDGTTFDTQSTYVIPVSGTQGTTYVFAGDRWQDPDLASSKYIWLPLGVSGNDLSLDFYDEWQVNVTTGEWRVYDEFVPQAEWTLLYVDSEETADEDGAATNAFDNSPSTKWHTGYGDDTPAPPHELQIDLGATYLLDAFRHLPRQDVDENGIIAEYEFYVSASAEDWGTPVATGSFDNDENNRAATLVEFPAREGRFVRFVAQSEYLGDAFTSLAELDVREAAP
jgi:hypothetical protein